MKDMFMAGMAMVAIIAVQVVLTYAFAYQVGELFSKVSFIVLFYHYVFKEINRKRKTEK